MGKRNKYNYEFPIPDSYRESGLMTNYGMGPA